MKFFNKIIRHGFVVGFILMGVLCFELSAKEIDFGLSLGLEYGRESARLDYEYITGDLSNRNTGFLVENVDVDKLQSILTYEDFSLLLSQDFYFPRILSYNDFNRSYIELRSVFQYHYEVVLFYHLIPLRIGVSFLDDQSDNLLLSEQRWQLQYPKSFKLYTAFHLPVFSLPLHLEGAFEMNPKTIGNFLETYYDASFAVILFFNYYINFKVLYGEALNPSLKLRRHILEFLFSYHVTKNCLVSLGLARVIYSLSESPMDRFSVGVQYFVDFL